MDLYKQLEKIEADIRKEYTYEISTNDIYISLDSESFWLDFLDELWLIVRIKNNMYQIEYYDKTYKNCSIEVVRFYIKELKKIYNKSIKLSKSYENMDHFSIVSKIRKKKIENIIKN